MTSLLFLGIAAGVCVLGFGILWALNRPPRSIEAHMEEFSRHIHALSPEAGPNERGRHSGRGSAGTGRRSG